MLRTRQQYLESLQDHRQLYFDGELVEDITKFKPLQCVLDTFASIFDLRFQYPDLLTCKMSDGQVWDRSWKIPTSYEDILKLRELSELYLDRLGEGLARTPPIGMMYLLCELTFKSMFGQTNPRYAQNIEHVWRLVANEDHLLCGGFPDPRGDRSVPIPDQEDPDLTLRIVERNDKGVIVRGAKLVSTGAPFANDLFITSYSDYPNAKHAPYAILGVVPLNLEGLKIVCRPKFTTDSSSTDWAKKQDEIDAFVIFDNVLIPNDRIFYAGDWQFANWYQRENAGWSWYGWWYAIQTKMRAELILGCAKLITDYTGTANFPAVKEKLAQLVLFCKTLDSLIKTSELECERVGDGLVQPKMSTADAAQLYGNENYSSAVQILRDLGGAFVVAVPEKDVLDKMPELDLYFQKYFGYRKKYSSANEKLALYRLIRDLTCSGFGARLEFLQMYQSGNNTTQKMLTHLYYDGYDRCVAKAKRAAEFDM
jgi:aromatic ring hydroxylase